MAYYIQYMSRAVKKVVIPNNLVLVSIEDIGQLVS